LPGPFPSPSIYKAVSDWDWILKCEAL